MAPDTGEPRRPPSVNPAELLAGIHRPGELLRNVDLGGVLLPELLLRRGQDVVRSDDLLAFRLELTNLRALASRPNDAKPPHLAIVHTGKPAYITLHFPPQHIAEQAFYQPPPHFKYQDGHVNDPLPEPRNNDDPPNPPIQTRIANPSRLVFRFDKRKLEKAHHWPVPYTLSGILTACRFLNLNVPPNARFQLRKRPEWFDRVEYLPPSEVAIRHAYDRLSNAELARVRVMERRNERLVRRHGNESRALLARRAELVESAESSSIESRRVYLPTNPEGLALINSLATMNRSAGVSREYASDPRPKQPAGNETTIELPFRLVISPHGGASFAHDDQPAHSTATGHTGLWHTRLAEKGEAKSGIHETLDDTIRAVWARGGPESDAEAFTDHWPARPKEVDAGTGPFLQTLDDRDRYNIAHLSGNFALPGGRHEAVDCERLMLSSLGGWLEAKGNWIVPNGLSVEQWVHRATQGRDHYVRVVYKGYLLPFGHRASLVKVSERFFHGDRSGNPAFLLQRTYLIVREPVRTFEKLDDPAPKIYHRAFPFVSVRILTEVTPDLANPASTQIGGHGQEMFWPALPGRTPFRFQYVATDLEGNEVQFDLPAIFIDNALANPAGGVGVALPNFKAASEDWKMKMEEEPSWCTAQLHLQKVAFAMPGTSGDTTSEVDSITFTAETEGLKGQVKDILIRPLIDKAEVRLPSISVLAGGQGTNTLFYDDDYLAGDGDGFGPGEVYARLEGGQTLDFTNCGNRSGGFVQPSLQPAGLSRLKGPVSGDLKKIAAGDFDPKDFFSSHSPLLFGCIPLGELLIGDNFGEMPSFVTEVMEQGDALITNLGKLEHVDKLILDLVTKAVTAAIKQAIQAAFEEVQQQLEVLGSGITEADAVVTAAKELLVEVDAGGIQRILEPPAVGSPSPVDDITNALDGLKSALADLSASPVQAVRQQVALVQQRIVQAQGLMLQVSACLVSIGNGLIDAAGDLVKKARLALDDLSKAVELVSPLKELGDKLKPLKLIDGAEKQTLLKLIESIPSEELLQSILETLLGDEIVVRLEFSPSLKDWPPPDDPHHELSGLGTLFHPNDPKGFSVAVEARIKKSGGDSTIDARCSLTHFDLILLGDTGFLQLDFEKIEFTAESSSKTEVDVVLSDIHFIGVLSFVEALRDLIPLDGFSDPPALTIDERGIDASFSVALPSLAVGVMNLSNLTLGAGFTVPFIGQPLSVRFFFCTREAPCNLTVTLFGGGGFFCVAVDPHGVQKLEAAFEFGAAIAIDFGVASGGIHVMAGIYYKMEPGKASLSGYFRMGGRVDVLGLIAASIELYLDLTYDFEEGKCIGRASLTIEVEVLFFSTSVTVTAERKLAGSSGDPSFAALMGPDEGMPEEESPWHEYCAAFA